MKGNSNTDPCLIISSQFFPLKKLLTRLSFKDFKVKYHLHLKQIAWKYEALRSVMIIKQHGSQHDCDNSHTVYMCSCTLSCGPADTESIRHLVTVK